jgi:RimJ/RimL family protein N-acetyltransferase
MKKATQKIEIIKRTKDSLRLRVPSHKAVTTELVERYLRGKIKSVGFLFPPVKLPKDGLQFTHISGKYSMKLGFGVDAGKARQLGKPPRKPKLRLIVPATIEEARKAYHVTHTKYFVNKFKQHLSTKEKYVAGHPTWRWMDKTISVLLLRDSELVGMFTLIRWKMADGNPCRLILWSCISPELGAAERQEAHYQATRWLRRNNLELPLRAAIHAFNVRSQKFHAKLGMRPNMVTAFRMH